MVKQIGAEVDISKVDFSDILPNAVIMSITITATHSKAAPLDATLLNKVLNACDEANTLDEHKMNVLNYLESRMSIFCPNVCALLGPTV